MLYVRRVSPTTELVFRGGVTVPTGNGDDDVNDFIVNAVGTTARITDTFQIIPEGLSLRLAVSPIIRSGQFFARFDGGIDINIDNAGMSEPDPVLRLNAGAGMDLGTVALTAELANAISTRRRSRRPVGERAGDRGARAGGRRPALWRHRPAARRRVRQGRLRGHRRDRRRPGRRDPALADARSDLSLR